MKQQRCLTPITYLDNYAQKELICSKKTGKDAIESTIMRGNNY